MAPSDVNWFPLGILCAFSLASADAMTKKFFADYTWMQLVLIRFAVPGLLLLPACFLYPLPPVPSFFWLLIVMLVPFELLAMWLYMLAIRDYPLHLTMPYLAFTPVFNVLTGLIILGEKVSMTGFSGILLVVAGAYFLNIDPGGSKAWLAPFAAIVRIRGSRLMLCVALIYSLTSVLGKMAMQYATPASFGPFYIALLGTIVLGIIVFCQPANLVVMVRRLPWLLLVGGCMAVMIVIHFIAIANVQVAYFIAVKRTSLLFGILYGFWLFKERNLLRHFIGGTLMVAGVTLIIAG